ncbi:TIGR04222 domain-containing membrane protein [Amycolatopsis sp. NPDC058986]|uniref:TIGR04222 domain-containing membrane protein n=1 Tax=unclassified Amycolatopsis TaxID=2618356 RepID=UPI00366A9CDA
MDEWWRVLCLLTYAVALGAAMVWAAMVRWELRLPRRAAPSRPLSIDEVAYLLGGAARLADTAIVRLVDQGTLRVSSSGLTRVAGADLTTARQNRVDAAVLRRLSQWRPTPVAAVSRDAVGEPEFAAVQRGLAGLGLVAGGRTRRRRWLPFGAVLVLFTIGAVRLIAEVGPRRPEGWLIACLAAVVISPLWWTRESRGPGMLTGLGRRVATQVRAGVATAGLWSRPAGLVALGGLGAHPDPELRTHLQSTTTEYAIPRAPLPSTGRSGPAPSPRRPSVRRTATRRHQDHWGGGCGSYGGDGGGHGGHGCGGHGCGGGDG